MDVFTAKSLEELLAKAATEKKVSVDELQYFITEEKKGFLGLGNQVSAEVYSMNDVTTFIDKYLKTFFAGLDIEADIEVSKEEELFKVMLNAENNAIIIGKMVKLYKQLIQLLKALLTRPLSIVSVF